MFSTIEFNMRPGDIIVDVTAYAGTRRQRAAALGQWKKNHPGYVLVRTSYSETHGFESATYARYRWEEPTAPVAAAEEAADVPDVDPEPETRSGLCEPVRNALRLLQYVDVRPGNRGQDGREVVTHVIMGGRVHLLWDDGEITSHSPRHPVLVS